MGKLGVKKQDGNQMDVEKQKKAKISEVKIKKKAIRKVK
jgi:hypothetical protein